MEKVKDILIRMIKTFIQGFLATLVVSIQSGEPEITKSIIIGAIAGGISAVMNLAIKLLERGGTNDIQ
jgi:hypothetical protein